LRKKQLVYTGAQTNTTETRGTDAINSVEMQQKHVHDRLTKHSMMKNKETTIIT